MKSNLEIEAEAERLMVLGRQYRETQRRTKSDEATALLPRLLARLTLSAIVSGQSPGFEEERVRPKRHEWFIEGAMDRDQVVFRLMSQETTMIQGVEIEGPPSVVMLGESAFEVLRTGYELAEAERLRELLSPYADREGVTPPDRATVAEVEAILDTNLLPKGDRLQERAEIAEFLEGRSEANVVIAHAVQRQLRRQDRIDRLAEWPELKLTIGEP